MSAISKQNQPSNAEHDGVVRNWDDLDILWRLDSTIAFVDQVIDESISNQSGGASGQQHFADQADEEKEALEVDTSAETDPNAPVVNSPKMKQLKRELQTNGVLDLTGEDREIYLKSVAARYNDVVRAQIGVDWVKAKIIAEGWLLTQIWKKRGFKTTFAKWRESLNYWDVKQERIVEGISRTHAYDLLKLWLNKDLIQKHFGETPHVGIKKLLTWVGDQAGKKSILDIAGNTKEGRKVISQMKQEVEKFKEQRKAASESKQRKPVNLPGFPTEMSDLVAKCQSLYQERRLGEEVMEEILDTAKDCFMSVLAVVAEKQEKLHEIGGSSGNVLIELEQTKRELNDLMETQAEKDADAEDLARKLGEAEARIQELEAIVEMSPSAPPPEENVKSTRAKVRGIDVGTRRRFTDGTFELKLVDRKKKWVKVPDSFFSRMLG